MTKALTVGSGSLGLLFLKCHHSLSTEASLIVVPLQLPHYYKRSYSLFVPWTVVTACLIFGNSWIEGKVKYQDVAESKLIPLATQQASKSGDKVLGQGTATLFRKRAA